MLQTRTRFIGTGYYVPERVVTNEDLTRLMDTSDEWIVERTGIRQRRWVPEGMTGAEMARRASRMAIEDAEIDVQDIDAIVLGTLSPDHFFPGTGVFLQRALGLETVPCLDLRAQCSGFVYGLSVADAWIRSGQYETVLLVGVEIQSTGLDLSTAGRDMAVLFGDGAGAAVLQATQNENQGVLTTRIHADGRHAEVLWAEFASSSHHPRIDAEMIAEGRHFPTMEGREVFKHAVTRMPEVVLEVLEANGLATTDLDLLVPHQANLRISQAVQRRLGLPDERVVNNIEKYGNTTAATIPIALAEAVREGRVNRGDLVCLVAFGSGFTWGASLIRW
ncbi:MAG: beta-ketoacyl-ACP synthase III [Longimicrobiales bacterium]